MGPLLMLVIGIVVVLLGLAVIVKLSRRRRLTSFHSAKLKELWAQMEANPNPAMRVIEADKILDHALKYLGFEGSLGDKLKAAGPKFSDLNAVWNAHKLRNRMAHEINAKPSEVEVRSALGAFKRGLKDLGMR